MDPHDDELPPPPPLPPNVEPIKADELPPPPPLPANVVPIKADELPPPPEKPTKPKRLLMARPGLGKKGQPIQLLANHYKVSVKSSEDFFHHYHVSIHIWYP